jgi:hypothetical protein
MYLKSLILSVTDHCRSPIHNHFFSRNGAFMCPDGHVRFAESQDPDSVWRYITYQHRLYPKFRYIAIVVPLALGGNHIFSHNDSPRTKPFR